MIASDVARAALMGSLLATVFLGLPVILVPLLAAATTTAGVAYPSSVAAVTPRLVASEDLAKANGARGMIGPACVAAGPALGAILLLIGPPQVAFAINACTFIISGLVVTSIADGPEFAAPARDENAHRGGAVPGREPGSANLGSVLADLRAGARIHPHPRGRLDGQRRHRGQSCLRLANSSPAGHCQPPRTPCRWLRLPACGPGPRRHRRRDGRRRLGTAAEKRTTLAAALFLVGGPLPFLAFTHSVFVAVALGLVAGMGAVISEVVADTRLQQTLDEAHLGTAYGFAFSASIGGIAVGALIAPLLVSIAGVSGALLVLAVAVLGLAATLAARSTTTAPPPSLAPANA